MHQNRLFALSVGLATALALSIFVGPAAQAQKLNVLHNFTGSADGSVPDAGLTMDVAGNLYGTTHYGSPYSCGTVFKLGHKGSGWIFTPLYSFAGGSDGCSPYARVTIGPDGSLYGTTTGTYGTVFNLKSPAHPPRAILDPWSETVLYRFTGGHDGSGPLGDLVFDQEGTLYGTTYLGGANGQGAAYELVPSDGGWTESVLYSFTGGNDGKWPLGGVIFDRSGNLYGTAHLGGEQGFGTVFELTPSETGWTEKVLYHFEGRSDGANPRGALIFDQSGNLYGTASAGGSYGCGTVFELISSPGGWTYNTLHIFNCDDGESPTSSLVLDVAGNLYGTTAYGGLSGCFGNCGVVFELTPNPNGLWTYTLLHEFTGSDGALPLGNVIFDANGNLYSTAAYGGRYPCDNGCGVVWEITP